MRVMLTGAGGFVGRNMLQKFAETGHSVLALDRSPIPDAELLPVGSTEFVEIDVLDSEALEQLVNSWLPEIVVQTAAITPDADLERDQPGIIFDVNAGSTLRLLRAAATSANQIIFLSSAAVYAPTDHEIVVTEDHPLRDAGGIYTISKIAGEHFCRWATETLGLATTILRVGPVFGPWERPTSTRSRMSLVCQAVDNARRGVPMYCNRPEAVYCWVYAPDVAAAVVALSERDATGSNTYNLAGRPVLMRQVLDQVRRNFPVATPPFGRAEVTVSASYQSQVLDSSRLEAALGSDVSRPFEVAIEEYAAWLSRSDSG